jgi:AraC-like DNA-binding protein
MLGVKLPVLNGLMGFWNYGVKSVYPELDLIDIRTTKALAIYNSRVEDGYSAAGGAFAVLPTDEMLLRFVEAVGYGPKMFQSILRFQRLLYLSHKGHAGETFAELAADVGYTDQAHMTREVRRFAGCSPTALLPSAACTLLMSDLFKTHDNSPDYS